jgi:hypothetical protein
MDSSHYTVRSKCTLTMKNFLRFLFLFFITLFVVVIHFFIVYTFSFPFDKVNILFIYLIFYLLLTERGNVVWLAFLTHIFIEVFPSNIFGVTLLSSSLAFIFSYWFHMYYITNRKWYGATTLIISTLLCYRILYSVFLFVFHRIAPSSSRSIQWAELWQLSVYEIALTSLLFTFLYLLLSKFSKTFSRALSK